MFHSESPVVNNILPRVFAFSMLPSSLSVPQQKNIWKQIVDVTIKIYPQILQQMPPKGTMLILKKS